MIKNGAMRPGALVTAICIAVLAGGVIALDVAAGSDSVVSGELVDEHFLDQVRIESDGEWFRLVIPVSAPWAHWTLSDPPRLVIDLGQTTSRLAQAPGLFQMRLDRGPVVALRTSQFSSEPLDRRVRLTLELSRMIPHEARRVGREIVVSIPDPVERTPATLVLGQSGIVGGGAAREAEQAARITASPEVAGYVDSPSVAEIEHEAITTPRLAPARTLREALESILDAEEAGRPEEAKSYESIEHDSSASAEDHGSQVEDSRKPPEDKGGPQEEQSPPPVPRPEPEKQASRASASGRTKESRHPSASTKPAEDTARPLTAVSSDLPPTGLPLEAREQNASRLLKQGIGSFIVEGHPARAEETLARASRFYGDTGPGEQAGILRRELLIVLGRSDEVGDLLSLPGAPDTSFVPGSVYRALVQEHMKKSDLMNLERLLRVWGPLYGPVLETAGLHLSLGEAFMLAGQLDQAESHILRIPDDDPALGRGLLLLARAAEDAGNKTRALELYRRASRSSPGPYRARALARTADLEFQAGHVTAALQGYSRLLQADPPRDEISWGEYQLGNCNLLLGNDEAARSHYESVVEKWPDSFWAAFAMERLDEMKWRTGFAGASQGGGR